MEKDRHIPAVSWLIHASTINFVMLNGKNTRQFHSCLRLGKEFEHPTQMFRLLIYFVLFCFQSI
jgi:hypothetical protein